MFMLALVITIIIADTLFRPHLTIMSSIIYMLRSVHKKNHIKIGEGKKTTWFSGGNIQYKLIFSGGNLSTYSLFRGGNEYWEKMSIQLRSIKQSIKQQKRDKQNIVPRGNTG
jgi:hypothetical protein